MEHHTGGRWDFKNAKAQKEARMTITKIEQISQMDSLKDIGNISITSEYTEPDFVKVLSDKNPFKLTNIFVDAGNPQYCDIDGVLYNKQQTALLCYPGAREYSEYVIPEIVIKIGRSAFEYASPGHKADKGLRRISVDPNNQNKWKGRYDILVEKKKPTTFLSSNPQKTKKA